MSALGGITRIFARSVEATRLSVHQVYRRLRGWDPRLVREREDELPQYNIVTSLATVGESLSEVGMKKRRTSWVSWHPSDRPILPTTGIAPSLRNASSPIARYRSWPAGIAAFISICLLVISFTGVPSALVGLPRQEWAPQCVSLVAVFGIGLPALFYTQSTVDLSRFLYIVPAAWPLVQSSGSVVAVGHTLQLLLIASGSLLSMGHPYIRGRLEGEHDRLELPDTSTQLSPVLSPAVMLGLAGSSLTLAPLVNLSVRDTVLTASQLSVTNTSELTPLLLLGMGCIVLACIYQTFRGGMVGVLSSALAFSTALGIGAVQHVIKFIPSIQGILAMLAMLTFVSLYVLKQSSNRVLGTQRLFSILLLVLLAGEYGLYPSLSDLFITPPDTIMTVYLMLSGLAAFLLFSAIGWLEQRAMARAA